MIKTFLIYFPSVLVARASAFLTVIVASHILSPYAFGYFSLITVIGEFTDAATTSWLRIAISRFGSQDKAVARQFAVKMGRIAALCAAAALMLAVATAEVLSREQFTQMAIALAAYLVAASLLRFGVTLHQAMGNKTQASLIEGGRAAAMLLATVVAMQMTHDYFVGSLAGSAVGLIGGLYAVASGLKATSSAGKDETALRVLFAYAVPLILLTLLTQAMTVLDKMLLKTFHDARTLGFYTAAFAVGKSGFDVVANAFNIGSFVQLASLYNSGRSEEAGEIVSRQLRYIIGITLPAAAVLICARGLVARTLFPPAYYDTFIAAVPFVAAGAIALNLKGFVYDNIFHLYLRNLRQLPSLIIGAIVAVAVGIAVIPAYPVIGAGSMFAAGAFSSLAASIWLSNSLLRVPFPWQSLFWTMVIAVVAGIGTLLLQHFLPAMSGFVLLGLLSLWAGLILAVSIALIAAENGRAAQGAARLKVVHVIFSLSTGGAEKLLADVLANLRSDSIFEYRLIVINDVYSEVLLQKIRAAGVEVHLLKRPKASKSPIFLLRTAALLLKIRPDVIHCHNCAGLYWVPMAYPPVNRVIYIKSVHATRVVKALNWTQRFVHRHVASKIIAVSKRVCDEYKTFVGRNIDIVYNGIDLTAYASGERPPQARDILSVISVGRISVDIKGHDLLIKALADCKAQGIDFNLMLVGPEADSEVGVKQKLESLAGSLDIGHRVHFLGERQDIAALLSDADIFVLSSRYEGFGLALVEAMASGLPVIASDIDGPREILRDGADGLLFASEDPKSLASALMRLAKDIELRRHLAEAGRLRARDFSIQNTIEKTEDIYISTLVGKFPKKYGQRLGKFSQGLDIMGGKNGRV